MNPFAIIQTGGKQLRVEPNQLIDIERVTAGKTPKEVVLDQVLVLRKGEVLKVGTPFVKGASVLCEFVEEVKGPKVISFKIRRRKNYRKKIGHRQLFSELRVKEIQFQE